MIVDGFDWDEGNLAKCGKHGVRREEIEHFFLIGAKIAPDAAHSERETRFIAVGHGSDDRPMFVAFTIRVRRRRRLIRPISARYMHRKEAARYAETA